MISENTFGGTPAAMYLARRLNEIGSKTLTRSVGKQITATNRVVLELINGYESGFISAKTLANTLRLMRKEVSESQDMATAETLVDQLRRNVQIGLIKRGIRQSTVARKAERVMSAPFDRSSDYYVERGEPRVTAFSFIDSTSGNRYEAGMLIEHEEEPPMVVKNTFYMEDVNDVTPELLMERSNRRCARLGKPHMAGKQVV